MYRDSGLLLYVGSTGDNAHHWYWRTKVAAQEMEFRVHSLSMRFLNEISHQSHHRDVIGMWCYLYTTTRPLSLSVFVVDFVISHCGFSPLFRPRGGSDFRGEYFKLRRVIARGRFCECNVRPNPDIRGHFEHETQPLLCYFVPEQRGFIPPKILSESRATDNVQWFSRLEAERRWLELWTGGRTYFGEIRGS